MLTSPCKIVILATADLQKNLESPSRFKEVPETIKNTSLYDNQLAEKVFHSMQSFVYNSKTHDYKENFHAS